MDDRCRFLAQRAVRDTDDRAVGDRGMLVEDILDLRRIDILAAAQHHVLRAVNDEEETLRVDPREVAGADPAVDEGLRRRLGLVPIRSEEHTSELQSLMRISYAVFCLKKKTHNRHTHKYHT